MSFDYRDELVRVFNERRQRNARYSLRAFARDLGMQPSKLSETLNRKKGLSDGTAIELARRLELSPQVSEIFRLDIKARHARSREARAEAAKELAKLGAETSTDTESESASHQVTLKASAAEDGETTTQISLSDWELDVPEDRIEQIRNLGQKFVREIEKLCSENNPLSAQKYHQLSVSLRRRD